MIRLKAERINQDQIRFTLSESDLAMRHLKVSELSYGSAKTQALFDDMMKTAMEQFGIDFREKPLMIEAIPISDDLLSITVTKVSGMAQLGALFGANLPEGREENPFQGGQRSEERLPQEPFAPGRSDRHLEESAQDPSKNVFNKFEFAQFPEGESVIYEFHNLEGLMKVAGHIPVRLRLVNELWKDKVTNDYYLICSFKKVDADIRYVVAMLTQFADNWDFGRRQEMLVKEHTKVIMKHRAIQKLAMIQQAE